LKHFTTITALALSSIGVAMAQSSSINSPSSSTTRITEVESEDIVITATKSVRKVSDAPVKTEVVTAKQIEQSHYRDLEEVLESLPGVSFRASTGREGSSAVLQGLSEDHVLVLIDGIAPLEKSSAGFDLRQISADEIERVEVVKGGASALYGSQAIGGVINVITKKSEKKTKVNVSVQSGYQTDNDIDGNEEIPENIRASISGQVDLGRLNKKLGYKFSGSRREQKPFDLDKNTITQDGSTFTKYNAAAAFDVQGQSSKTSAKFSFYSEESKSVGAIETPIGGFLPREGASDYQSYSYTLIHDRDLTELSSLKATAHYSETDDELVLADDPSTAYPELLKTSKQDQVKTQLEWSTLYNNHYEILVGASFSRNTLDQTSVSQTGSTIVSKPEIDGEDRSSTDIFTQHSLVYDQFEATLGVRGQRDSDFGEHFSPKISVRYSPQLSSLFDTNIRASVGTGYRVPSLKERYYVLDHRSFADYIVQGNTDLQPEKSLSYQLGAEVFSGKKWNVHVNGFLNKVDDMIDFRETQGNGVDRIFLYQNYKEVQSAGVELSSSIRLLNKLTFSQDWTYSEILNKENDFLVPLRPKSVYRSNLSYDWSDRFQTIATWQFKSDQFTDEDNTNVAKGYGTIDFKLNYQVQKQTQLFFGIDNVSDIRRDAARDGESSLEQKPIYGRYIYVGINLKG
jgi:outer membrane receptor for ferrienterochelin and colicins